MLLVLVRHGQTDYNLEKKFCGWTDVDINETGRNECIDASNKIKESNIIFDVAYTSVLKRANNTLDIILKQIDQTIPINYSWMLNERHYGALQGLTHNEMEEKYGKEQVHIWRRSANIKPPQLTIDDSRYPGNDIKYKDVDRNILPLGECLLDTCKRVSYYYENNIKKDLLNNKNVLVVAHGNSLRALIKHIDNISDDDIVNIEVPTGKPIVYVFNTELNKIKDYYL